MIKVSIEEVKTRGPNVWAYSVNIGTKLFKIGFGHDYASANKLASSGVKAAQKYLKNLIDNPSKTIKL